MKTDRGRSGEDRGRSGEDRGRSGDDRGRSGDDRGRSGDDRGRSGDDRGRSGDDRGRSGDDRGRSDEDRGRSDEDRGRSDEDRGGQMKTEGGQMKTERGQVTTEGAYLSLARALVQECHLPESSPPHSVPHPLSEHTHINHPVTGNIAIPSHVIVYIHSVYVRVVLYRIPLCLSLQHFMLSNQLFFDGPLQLRPHSSAHHSHQTATLEVTVRTERGVSS